MQRLERVEAMIEQGTGDTPKPAAAPAPPDAAEPVPADDEGGEAEATASRSVAEPVDLDRLRDLWPAVVDQLRDSGSELLSTLLEAARPVAVDAEEAVLKVGFPAAAAFNKRKAEATEARDRVAEAVRAIAGERLRPVFVLLEGDEGDEQAGPAMSDEELVEAVKSAFDAEEVSVDDEPEEPRRKAAG